jgi:Rieske Fe-S protein
MNGPNPSGICGTCTVGRRRFLVDTALRWNAPVHRFQCPKHHSQYQPDGTFIEGRATRSMDRFAVRRDGNTVVVDLDTVFEQDRDAPGWKVASLSI